jgi:multiple sugar transport system substrate-binding protein|tara:strand:+ start:586 stop:2007 length:1422 start_codon:yes stop_codon:yes gene_type:complete
MYGKLPKICLNTATRSLASLLVTAVVGLSVSTSAYAWSYKEAAAPYKGTTIRVLDEVTPLQETMKTLVPEFEKETGIKTEYELLNHFDVIGKGQADMLSGRGHFDAVMLHSFQMGPLLDAGVVVDITGLLSNGQITNPDLALDDLIEPSNSSTTKYKGKQYGFLNWNYNHVYWARNDLLSHAGEQSAFKAKYGYDLAPAKTMQQMRDIAEFFTRKKGEQLAGTTLQSDFFGIVMEGIKGGTTFPGVWFNFLTNWGGGLLDEQGAPAFDTPQNIAALRFWGDLWNFSPPGQAEYSLIDVPTVMGNGIAAQTIAWSDFVFGIDVPGKSALHGKFVYGNIPRNDEFDGPMTTAGEPSVIVISKASKNVEAAYLFMQWMVDRTTQEKLLNAGGGGVPIRNSSWDLPVMKGPAVASLAAAMRESMKGSHGKPKMPNFFEVYDEMASIIQQIGLGQITPEEGVKIGQQKLLKICKKCLL